MVKKLKLYDIHTIDGEEYAVLNQRALSIQYLQNLEVQYKESRIPKNYWPLDFKDYKGNISIASKKYCEEYSTNCKDKRYQYTNLYLVGAHSSQKTMLMCAVAKECIKQKLKVKYRLAGDLINDLLKDQGFSYDTTLHAEIKKLKEEYDLICIDDVFDTKKSLYWHSANKDSIISAWYTFIQSCISNNVRLIVTSSVPITKLGEYYGESIYELVSREFKELRFSDTIRAFRQSKVTEN